MLLIISKSYVILISLIGLKMKILSKLGFISNNFKLVISFDSKKNNDFKKMKYF